MYICITSSVDPRVKLSLLDETMWKSLLFHIEMISA